MPYVVVYPVRFHAGENPPASRILPSYKAFYLRKVRDEDYCGGLSS
jgi:hypothetical protein